MKVIDLEPRQEFLFKVGEEPIKMELKRGLAEVYGTEMLLNRIYTFAKNSKASVFTYHGATIELTGQPMKSHVSKTGDYMMCYLEVHRDFEKMRETAEKMSEQYNFNATAINNTNGTTSGSQQSDTTTPQTISATGTASTAPTTHGDLINKPDLKQTPICLVCEPLDARNVGKSTLCRILLNYAARRGRAPIFVDLDPDQNHIGLPGTIGALSIESPIDIETGLKLTASMLMHFGHTSPSADSELRSGLVYKSLVENMAKIVHSKLEQDKKSFYSGVIINTSSWSDSNDYKVLVDACKAFKVNMVLVMDDEVLQDDIQKDLSSIDCKNLRVFNMPKTVEIYKSRAAENVELRYQRIKEYFYGRLDEPYNPMTSEVKFSFLKRLIYRIGNPLMLPDSLMPLGSKAQDSSIKVSQYDCSASDLLHHILAISYCRIDDVLEDPESILRTNIMGFICITSVRAEGDIVSILTPQKLPNPMDYILLYSDIQYMDSLI